MVSLSLSDGNHGDGNCINAAVIYIINNAALKKTTTLFSSLARNVRLVKPPDLLLTLYHRRKC